MKKFIIKYKLGKVVFFEGKNSFLIKKGDQYDRTRKKRHTI